MAHIISTDPWPHIVSTGLLDRNVIDEIHNLQGPVDYGQKYKVRSSNGYNRYKFQWHMDGNSNPLPIDVGCDPLNEIFPERLLLEIYNQCEWNIQDNWRLLHPNSKAGFHSIMIEFVREWGGPIGPISRNTPNKIENIIMLQAGAGAGLAQETNGLQLWKNNDQYVRDIQWVLGRTVSFTASAGQTFYRMPTTEVDGQHSHYVSTKYLNIALR